MSESDIELLARYRRERSEEAFSEIVRRHLALVHSAALRQVRLPQLAEEIAQTTFLELARQADRLQPTTQLAAWLYEATRRNAVDVLRRESRRDARERTAMELNSLNAGPSEWSQMEPVLDDAMEELPSTDRTAILLRYFENRSLRDVGAALGVSDDAAQKRVSRAIDELRSLLVKRGVTMGAGALIAVVSGNAVQAAPTGLALAISASAALAGTNVAAITSSTAAKAIAMTTLQKTLVLATAVTLGVGFYEARQASARKREAEILRQENGLLAESNEQLVRERDLAKLQLDQMQQEIARLKNSSDELAKLRRDSERVAQQADVRSQPRVTEATSAALKFAFGTELQDMGASTPERAASSLIWAVGSGDVARVSELLELPATVSQEEAPKHYAFLSRQFSNVWSRLEFTAVTSIKPNEDGSLRLNFVYRENNSDTLQPFPFLLRPHDSGWKVLLEGEVPKSFPSP